MGDDLDTGGGGCAGWLLPILVVIVIALLYAAVTDGGTRISTTTNRADVRILSDNQVRILSPEINTYVDVGDTETRVTGDRNQVAPAAGCWLSAAQAWGECPAWAPEGSAVP